MSRWTAGLGGVAIATFGLAVGLCAWAAALFHEWDLWNRTSSGTTVYPDEVIRYYWSLQDASFAMQQLATPLVMGACLAVLLLLGVLAVRWERREAAVA